VKKGEYIWNPKENSGFLITFRDFLIREDCLSKKKSAAEIGYGYERPNSDICPDEYTFLAGSYRFQVSELEVYQVPEIKKIKACKKIIKKKEKKKKKKEQ